MPYKWDQTDTHHSTLELWPHSSLPAKGFVYFIWITFVLITLPLFAVMGTAVFWGLLPFLMITVAAVYFAIQKNYSDRNVTETLVVSKDLLHLQRRNPKGDIQEWDCNTYWAKVHKHDRGGPVPNYVTLSGNGREDEIGAFLSEEERVELYAQLSDSLAKCR